MVEANPDCIAVVADIHGNLPALEAVVADLATRDVSHVINLGDHVSGPLWPRETAALLMDLDWTHLSGNCDRAVAHGAQSLGASDRFALDRITDAQRSWLRGLPTASGSAEGILAFHGTPDSDSTYLLESVTDGATRPATASELRERLGAKAINRARVFLCGHSHVPRVVSLDDALIVNPGSVGLPAFDSDDPQPHRIETGAAVARYAILRRIGERWEARQMTIEYDHEAAARRAEQAERADWAQALRTGRLAE